MSSCKLGAESSIRLTASAACNLLDVLRGEPMMLRDLALGLMVALLALALGAGIGFWIGS